MLRFPLVLFPRSTPEVFSVRGVSYGHDLENGLKYSTKNYLIIEKFCLGRLSSFTHQRKKTGTYFPRIGKYLRQPQYFPDNWFVATCVYKKVKGTSTRHPVIEYYVFAGCFQLPICHTPWRIVKLSFISLKYIFWLLKCVNSCQLGWELTNKS